MHRFLRFRIPWLAFTSAASGRSVGFPMLTIDVTIRPIRVKIRRCFGTLFRSLTLVSFVTRLAVAYALGGDPSRLSPVIAEQFSIITRIRIACIVTCFAFQWRPAIALGSAPTVVAVAAAPSMICVGGLASSIFHGSHIRGFAQGLAIFAAPDLTSGPRCHAVGGGGGSTIFWSLARLPGPTVITLALALARLSGREALVAILQTRRDILPGGITSHIRWRQRGPAILRLATLRSEIIVN
jgi:hypothetical protein